MKVYKAQGLHIDLLAPLFDSYRIFYHQESNMPAARQFLEHLIKTGDATILIAIDEDGTGVGFTTLYPTYSSVGMAPIVTLNDLYVHPDHRQKGVGEQLILQATDWASNQGAIRLELETETDNHFAQNLYKKMGWQLESNLHFSYAIEK